MGLIACFLTTSVLNQSCRTVGIPSMKLDEARDAAYPQVEAEMNRITDARWFGPDEFCAIASGRVENGTCYHGSPKRGNKKKRKQLSKRGKLWRRRSRHC